MYLSIRILGLIAVLAGMMECRAQSPVAVEWKQRFTESMRERVVRQSANPFEIETLSSTRTIASNPPMIEESLPILSSLTQLLTNAATETVTLSREIRPSVDWSDSLRNLGDSARSSWSERFKLVSRGQPRRRNS